MGNQGWQQIDVVREVAEMAEEKVEERCQHLHERDVLGQAIADAAIKAGIVDSRQPLTGPQLVMLCNDLACAATTTPNTRQRAERAAQIMMEMFARQGRRYLNDRLRQQLADIIAAEFEK